MIPSKKVFIEDSIWIWRVILEEIFDKFLCRHSSAEKEYIIIMICLIDFLHFRKDKWRYTLAHKKEKQQQASKEEGK